MSTGCTPRCSPSAQVMRRIKIFFTDGTRDSLLSPRHFLRVQRWRDKRASSVLRQGARVKQQHARLPACSCALTPDAWSRRSECYFTVRADVEVPRSAYVYFRLYFLSLPCYVAACRCLMSVQTRRDRRRRHFFFFFFFFFCEDARVARRAAAERSYAQSRPRAHAAARVVLLETAKACASV